MNIRKEIQKIKWFLRETKEPWGKGRYLWSDLTDKRTWSKWRIGQIAPLILLNMTMGRYALRQMEWASQRITVLLRRQFNIRGRISDNAIGALLALLKPEEVGMMLWNQVKAMLHRKHSLGWVSGPLPLTASRLPWIKGR